MEDKFVVIGGAGFIGSHFVRELLKGKNQVVVLDDYSTGFENLLDDVSSSNNLKIIRLDVRLTDELIKFLSPDTTVIHLASNPDIAAAALNPRIDFLNGTVLTESVVEASRIAGVKRILYASGSGVYGESKGKEFKESDVLAPVSPYGASKLSGEAILSAYSNMFGITCTAFRFANVVGPNQTHGVGYDFINKLRKNPNELLILGDGTQSKPYIYVKDVVSAVLQTNNTQGKSFDVFNVSTKDQVTVNEIAKIVIDQLNLSQSQIRVEYSGGPRGWSGDVPNVQLNTDKITANGWSPTLNSKEAITLSISQMSRI